jgi:serine/threonine protein kinase
MSAMRDLPDTVVVETLRKDGEFVISRAKNEAGLPRWLLVSAVSERPGPEIVAQLQQAYALRDELEPSWATRPLELVQYQGKPTLILSDPGGIFLDDLLGRPMEVTSFLRMALGITTALGQFHARKLIHRDLRPANVMVNPTTGDAWLTGFGVAVRLPGDGPASGSVEVAVGTLPYMSPEQTLRINRSVDSEVTG